MWTCVITMGFNMFISILGIPSFFKDLFSISLKISMQLSQTSYTELGLIHKCGCRRALVQIQAICHLQDHKLSIFFVSYMKSVPKEPGVRVQGFHSF